MCSVPTRGHRLELSPDHPTAGSAAPSSQRAPRKNPCDEKVKERGSKRGWILSLDPFSLPICRRHELGTWKPCLKVSLHKPRENTRKCPERNNKNNSHQNSQSRHLRFKKITLGKLHLDGDFITPIKSLQKQTARVTLGGGHSRSLRRGAERTRRAAPDLPARGSAKEATLGAPGPWGRGVRAEARLPAGQGSARPPVPAPNPQKGTTSKDTRRRESALQTANRR